MELAPLHAPGVPRLAEIQLPVNVHFNNAGWDVLGRKVASTIEAVLNSDRR
jgi:hypothetical protein